MPTKLDDVNEKQRELAVARWRTAKALHDQGMSLRAIGKVMGVTHARVGQMLKKLEAME